MIILRYLYTQGCHIVWHHRNIKPVCYIEDYNKFHIFCAAFMSNGVGRPLPVGWTIDVLVSGMYNGIKSVFYFDIEEDITNNIYIYSNWVGKKFIVRWINIYIIRVNITTNSLSIKDLIHISDTVSTWSHIELYWKLDTIISGNLL